MWNPLSWVMEAAAIMAIALANGGVRHTNLLTGFKFHFQALFLWYLYLWLVYSKLRLSCDYAIRGSHQIGRTLLVS